MTRLYLCTCVGLMINIIVSIAQAGPPIKAVQHLHQLSCAAGEITMYSGVGWVCSDMSVQLEATINALIARVNALENENLGLKDRLACVSSTSNDAELVFEGCNIHIRNGKGMTRSVNGLGNLIIGYNEDAYPPTPKDRTGSHNLVVGPDHIYSNYGGFVAGEDNSITGTHASVCGGTGNIASGDYASVSGGIANTASGTAASVSGGRFSEASGTYSSVSGGTRNLASGSDSSVSGGSLGIASGLESSVSGGNSNTASGIGSSVTAGSIGKASGLYSSVSGGNSNHSSNEGSSISGGVSNISSGVTSSVSGGSGNTAEARDSSILGGLNLKTIERYETIP